MLNAHSSDQRSEEMKPLLRKGMQRNLDCKPKYRTQKKRSFDCDSLKNEKKKFLVIRANKMNSSCENVRVNHAIANEDTARKKGRKTMKTA